MRSSCAKFALIVFFAVVFDVSVMSAQATPTSSSPPFTARLVELSTASCKGFEGKSLSGLILEIENAQPGLDLALDAASVKVKTKDGGVHSPVLLFFVKLLRGNVQPVFVAGGQLEGKEILIGDTTYEAYKSMATMAVNMVEGAGAKYIFKELSVLQLAFVFPVSEENIVSLDFLTQSLDLSRTDMNLSGDWEGTTTGPEMTFGVSFAVDQRSMFLSGAKVVFECREGEPRTKARMTADSRTRIGKDGSFEVAFKQTGDTVSTLSGKFVSPKQVAGDLKGGLSAQCGAKMVKVAGKWSVEKD